jgi:myo-inositol-1(or 4)-monophosphatase
MRRPCASKGSPLLASDRTFDPQAAARELANAMRDAGEAALGFFRSSVRSWMKDGNSPVSEADLAVDHLLRQRLLACVSDSGWLSEETADNSSRLSTRRVWIVDPIDGTRAFLAGHADWTISAALVESGRPVLGAIYAPVSDEMFSAIAGSGAFHNGAAIAVDPGTTLAGARVAGPKTYLRQLSAQAPNIIAEPKIHSLALRLARVAQGRLDIAFASFNSHDWDLAAADLLVHEAGGMLTNLTGASLAYNRPEPIHGALIAAGPGRHRAFSDLIRNRSIVFR